MNKPLRKFIFWGTVFAVNFLMVSVAFSFLVVPEGTRTIPVDPGSMVVHERNENFRLDPPDWWAGYDDHNDWSIYPFPRLLKHEAVETLQRKSEVSSFQEDQRRYRLLFFNDREVITMPGILSFSATLSDQRTEGGHLVR